MKHWICNMGDDKILRQNKIPGCDELTRPEEIKALSKFLRHIKDVQSEHTKLQKDNLEIPGRTTGKIPYRCFTYSYYLE